MKRIAKHTICVSPGEYIAPGQEVELTKAQERALEATGALEAESAMPLSDPNAGGTEKPTGDDLLVAIVDAIRTIDPNATGAWTADGKPSTQILKTILGYEVTGPERDTAWVEAQEAA